MLRPTKHEKLENNILVIGAFIIEQLYKENCVIEDIYIEYCKLHSRIDVDTYFNAVTMLYIIDKIEIDRYNVRLKL